MVLSVGDEYEGEVFGSQSFVYLLLFFQKQEGVLEPATYIGAEGGSQVSLQIVQIENNILGILSEIGAQLTSTRLRACQVEASIREMFSFKVDLLGVNP